MDWSGRMGIAIDAMSLFVRSLPQECSFSIIGFGSRFKVQEIDGKEVIAYTDESREKALNCIKNYSANLGGT